MISRIRVIHIFLSLFFTNYGLALPSLHIQGTNFVDNSTGNRFQIVGVAYQPGGSSGFKSGSGVDPLSNASICLRDAALMQQLGINTVRVYNIDPKVNHDMCASIFNKVGIYMIVDVNSPLDGESLNRANPSASYNIKYLQRTFNVVESFKNYPNTLMFFSGNEVINDIDTASTVPPYIRLLIYLGFPDKTKAVTRDLKNYIRMNSQRKIFVGYSAADVREILADTFNYFHCSMTDDASDPSRADIFALNSYSWCGNSSYTQSGYDVLLESFKNSSTPVFFSEYGCNNPAPRIFTEVPIIYGPLMAPILSGGVMYEYSEEPSKYGLVEINSDGSANLKTDYEILQTQFRNIDFKSKQNIKEEKREIKPPKCSSSLIKATMFYNIFDIPEAPPGVKELIEKGTPDAPSGKLVEVTDFKVIQNVKKSNGELIPDLVIRPVSSSSPDNAGNFNPTGSTASSILSATVTELATGKTTDLPLNPTKSSSKASGSLKRNTNVEAIFGITILVFISLLRY